MKVADRSETFTYLRITGSPPFCCCCDIVGRVVGIVQRVEKVRSAGVYRCSCGGEIKVGNSLFSVARGLEGTAAKETRRERLLVSWGADGRRGTRCRAAGCGWCGLGRQQTNVPQCETVSPNEAHRDSENDRAMARAVERCRTATCGERGQTSVGVEEGWL